MTSESPTQIGRRAEDAAAGFLQKQGLVPAARNWRRRSAEIDLVMRDGDEWVFVEVRRRDRWRDAAESVDENKRRRIVRAARRFLADALGGAGNDAPCRFDAALVDDDEKILWLRDILRLDS